MAALEYAERPADGEPRGLLVLHHGRGSDEHDLLGLAGIFDPQRRLHVVTPRAPLQFPGAPGYHWYDVPRVGHPDPDTFAAGYAALTRFHDELWERTGVTPERTVLGGFSQGTVMSLATGLGAGRPAPAAILGLSGFIPTVPGWSPDPAGRAGMPVLLAHGRRDPVIPFVFAERAHEQLAAMGLNVELLSSEAAHHVDPRQLPQIADWISLRLP